jgi:hypothetical protein
MKERMIIMPVIYLHDTDGAEEIKEAKRKMREFETKNCREIMNEYKRLKELEDKTKS